VGAGLDHDLLHVDAALAHRLETGELLRGSVPGVGSGGRTNVS
jgi:hypothetical protein